MHFYAFFGISLAFFFAFFGIHCIYLFNRMIVEELTEYFIASQIDVQVRQVLDRL
jgi:hypothetical protein